MDIHVYEDMLVSLSEEKKKKIKRYINRRDAIRSLLGDILIRLNLCKTYGYQNNNIEYGYNKYEKPYLENQPEINFNISHSGDWVFSVFDSNSVGIDVEKTKEMDISMARRFFAYEEYLDLMQKCSNEQMPYLFDLWTLKESYIKATGKGFFEGLDSFCVKVINNQAQLVYAQRKDPVTFYRYELDEGYKLAVCSFSSAKKVDFRILPFDKICKDFYTYIYPHTN